MEFEIIPPYGLCDSINYNVSEVECVQYSFITPLDPDNEYLANVQMPSAPLDDLALTIFGVNGTKVLETINFIPLGFNKTEYSSYNKTCILKNFPYTDTFNFAISATNGLNKEFINSFDYAFESLCDKAKMHTDKPAIITLTSVIALSVACSVFLVCNIIIALPKVIEYCKSISRPDDHNSHPANIPPISSAGEDAWGPHSSVGGYPAV